MLAFNFQQFGATKFAAQLEFKKIFILDIYLLPLHGCSLTYTVRQRADIEVQKRFVSISLYDPAYVSEPK